MSITTKTFGTSTQTGALWNAKGNLNSKPGMTKANVQLVKAPTDKPYTYQLKIVYPSGKTWTYVNLFVNDNNSDILQGSVDFKDVSGKSIGSGEMIKIIKAKEEFRKSDKSPTSIIYTTPFIVNQTVVDTNKTVSSETPFETIETQTEEDVCPF